MVALSLRMMLLHIQRIDDQLVVNDIFFHFALLHESRFCIQCIHALLQMNAIIRVLYPITTFGTSRTNSASRAPTNLSIVARVPSLTLIEQ